MAHFKAKKWKKIFMKRKFDLDLNVDHITSHDQKFTVFPFSSLLNPKRAHPERKIQIKCRIMCVKNLFYHKNVNFRCPKCSML